MGTVKIEDIVGYRIGGELVCDECVQKGETDDLEENDYITGDELEKEDEIFFCDRCKKKL